MRGGSALDRLLAAFPDAKLRIQVVWEPVLRTNIAAPTSRVLALIDDPRVTQYWDPARIVSADIVRAVNADPVRYGFHEPLPPGFIAWDVVAVFGRSELWERDLPPPAYYGGPVVDAIDDARKSPGRVARRGRVVPGPVRGS